MVLAGEDLMRGINYASKRRPLLSYWFRVPPKVTVEITSPFDKDKDQDIDPTLLMLEKAWLPTGKIQEDRHLAISDKFDGMSKKEREKAEAELARAKEDALLDKDIKKQMEAQKREALLKKKEQSN